MKNKSAKLMDLAGRKGLIVLLIVIIVLSAIIVGGYFLEKKAQFFSIKIPKLGDNIASVFTKEKDANNENSETEPSPITIEEAKAKALETFIGLGEEKLKQEDVNLIKTRRAGIEYYYVKSRQNTIEIEIDTGRVNKINGEKQ